MPSLSAKRFINKTIVLAMMLTTSLAQPTYNDQSATECDAHVIERLDDVTGQLTHLHHDVAAALQRAPATSGSNCEREYSNMAQLHADVSAIRHAMESLNVPRRSLTNYTSAGTFPLQVNSLECRSN